MWTDKQQARYNLLRDKEHAGELAENERSELDALIQQIEDAEAAYLAPANERKAAEVAELAAAAERLEAENRELRQYLRDRQAFLARGE